MKGKYFVRFVSVIAAACLLLTISSTYATWWYSQGRLPSSKKTDVGISMIFPIPTNGLYIRNMPDETGNLWGAMDENGKIPSVSKAQEYLLKDYTPFGIDVANQSTKRAKISFQISVCLHDDYIEAGGWYPFEDKLSIKKNNPDGTQVDVLSGILYYPNGETSGDFALSKASDTVMYSVRSFILTRNYYLYTVTIDPAQLDPAAFAGFDINNFIVDPQEQTTFVMTVEHTQTNNYACFAEIKVIATEYTE